jgi:hypothetical protein
VWAVPLVVGGWQPEDFAAEETGEPLARKKLENKRRFETTNFRWFADSFLRRVKIGERVLQVTNEGKGRIFVSGLGKVVRKHGYRAAGEHRAVIFLQIPRGQRRKGLQSVLARVGPLGKPLKDLRTPRKLSDKALVNQLGLLWPS